MSHWHDDEPGCTCDDEVSPMTGPVVPSDEDELRDRYGHTKADHEAVGACRRPSMAARVAASATELPMGSDAAMAFGRGYDVALADRERYADQRAAEELRDMARDVEAQHTAWNALGAGETLLRVLLDVEHQLDDRADALTAREEAGR